MLILPPAELAVCKDEPVPPALPEQDWTTLERARIIQRSRDELTLDYILGLRSAWGDCRAQVDGLAAWRERAGER